MPDFLPYMTSSVGSIIFASHDLISGASTSGPMSSSTNRSIENVSPPLGAQPAGLVFFELLPISEVQDVLNADRGEDEDDGEKDPVERPPDQGQGPKNDHGRQLRFGRFHGAAPRLPPAADCHDFAANLGDISFAVSRLISRGGALFRARRNRLVFLILSGLLMVGVSGFEPPTPASRRQCSTRLSYTPRPIFRL